VYAIGDGAANNLTTVGWATSSGGVPATNNFPLAQDTAIVDNTTNTPTLFVTPAFNLGTLDSSSRTTAITIQTSSGTPSIYGNFKFGTGVTSGSTGNSYIFSGRGTQTITSNGITFGCPVTIDCATGTVQLADALTIGSARTLTLTSGTFDAVAYNVTTGRVTVSGSSTRLKMGSGTWTLSGTGTVWNYTGTNFTVTGTGTISLTSASAKTFAGGGVQTYPTLNQGGAGALTISGSNKFANITNTTQVGDRRVQFTGGTTNEFTSFNLNGVSGNLLTIESTNGTQVTLKKPSAWNVGTGSVDGGNNTGLSFTAGGNNYLYIRDVIGVVVSGVILAYITETTTASETASARAVFLGTLSETTTAAETTSAGAVFLGTLSESATAADVVAAFNAYLASIAESTTASDLAAATMSFASAVSELTTASDAATVLRTTVGAVSETTQAADTITGGLLYLASISEATTASEIAAAVRAFNAAIFEATTASEVETAKALFFAAVPEQVSGADVLAALATLGGSVSELAAAADAARRAKIKVVNIEDFVATEAVTTAMTVEATVTGNTASGTVESGQITATVLP
jgi:hypothetical protein